MSENAELWAKKGNERNILVGWLKDHRIDFQANDSTEKLIELYRKKECEE